ncbi:bacteriocin resistance YdeI/OmpD-like protein [Nocardia tenerifensis]|uniref:Bacteriocin resistance YdeI/OmpD-like protein n=1 Tax=Nocardia tenerifensis TaxID=228006 RepID=A0A318KD96_9NOCA|nr:YdeI/OmpD-associated family protein [Nocardia tenerifensis]PXX69049.1 bacteriocin resistance YdeI/OmpD-like protein [Nocardia tenerifensis]
MRRFEATIEAGAGGGAYVAVPAEIVAELGGGGRIPVAAAFDGVEYRGSIADMGAGPCLGVLKAIRAELGKGPGDRVVVTLARDDAERTVQVPDDLAEALRSAGLRAAFDALSYSRRREHVAKITEAKAAETRARRIAKVVDSLR